MDQYLIVLSNSISVNISNLSATKDILITTLLTIIKHYLQVDSSAKYFFNLIPNLRIA